MRGESGAKRALDGAKRLWQKSGVRWALGYAFILLCGAALVYYWRLEYGFAYFSPGTATLLVCAFFSAMYLAVFLCAHFVRQRLAVKTAVLIFCAGACFAAANPPLQAPDETMHFVRSYALGMGDFTFDQNKDYPADVDALAAAFPGFYNQELIAPGTASMTDGFERYRAILDGEEAAAPNASTVTQQFFYYLPQAAGVAAGRLFGADALVCLYLARAANLVFYALLCGAAVRLARRYLPVLIALMASPIALFIAASCSPDAMFLGASWVFLGVCLSGALTQKRAAALAVCFAAMFYIKFTAVGMLPLLALLAPEKQGLAKEEAKRARKKLLAAALACAAAAFVLYEALSAYTALASNYGRVPYADTGVDPAAQLAFILQNPVRYAAVFVYSLYRDKANLFSAGSFGWMDMSVPFVNYFTPMVWLFAAGLCAWEAAQEKLRNIWLMGVCAALLYATTYTGMYLTSTPVTLPEINGVQTRYLLGAFFCVFAAAAALLGRTMALQDAQRAKAQKTPPAWRMLHISYCYAALSAILLFQSYYLGP